MGFWSRLVYTPRGTLHYAAAHRHMPLRSWAVVGVVSTAAGVAVGAALGSWQNGGLVGFAVPATVAAVYRHRGRGAVRRLHRSG